MRPILLVSAMLLSCATPSAAFALQADDTMQAWKTASSDERAHLLEEILGRAAAARTATSRCMNETSMTPGHADLSIGEVAKVCAMPSKTDQPV